jgi:UDP-N-acetylmuramoyl-tripeptide--D-alanyl-D-alanine ligase
MIETVKRRLYFVVAHYFGFWAKFVLRRWQPRIIAITGSTGKTTLLHLVEAQLGKKAIFSHHANSALGVPFHILGLPSNVESKGKWLAQVARAPFAAFRKPPVTKLYVVEADCDRPNEGKFLGNLLKPEVTLWVTVFRTHSMNFDPLVPGTFATHEEAIAYEFGHLAANTQKLVVANGDQLAITDQLGRVAEGVEIVKIHRKGLQNYANGETDTVFTIANKQTHLSGLQPKELGDSLQMVNCLLSYLDLPLDPSYAAFELPPGRSSVFEGKNGLTLVDSTYNTGLGAMSAILGLFNGYSSPKKWVILGDILEQGSLEKGEHQRLAEKIAALHIDHVVLLGPRTHKYTYPILKEKLTIPVVSFDRPDEVLEYLRKNLKGGEALLFKGGRFLEGVIEQLLKNPSDARHLVRRESSWVKRRQKWGLPR